MNLEGFNVTDMLGSASKNGLSQALADGSQRGAVITVANSEAIRVAMVPAVTTQIIIVDISEKHVTTATELLAWAGQSSDMEGWFERIERGTTGPATEKFLGLVKSGDFGALKTRLPHIIKVVDDLARDGVVRAIRDRLGNEAVGVVYCSNIEWYVGNNLFSQAQSSRTQYRSNILELMGENTRLVRGSSVFMTVHDGRRAAEQDWR